MSAESPVTYVLTGPVKGHTRECFGFKFKDGECVISAEAHRNCGHVLQAHYSAFPKDQVAAEAAPTDPVATTPSGKRK